MNLHTPLFVAATLLCVSIAARGEATERAPRQVVIELRDGSSLRGVPVSETISMTTFAAGKVEVRWSQLRQLSVSDDRESAVAAFKNQDRLSGVVNDAAFEFTTLLGLTRVPVGAVVRITDDGPTPDGIDLIRNVALHKTVHGQDGASHGKGLRVHLTDGDFKTHTKPPSSRCDYTIDLRDHSDGTKNDHAFQIDTIVVHWGEFGTRFLGIPKDGGGWASGSWPGPFVTQYQIEYRTADDPDGDWIMAHEFNGQPADEDAQNVHVVVTESKRQGAGGDVTTTITGVDLSNVVALRIRSRGGHWIGIYELEAHGYPKQ